MADCPCSSYDGDDNVTKAAPQGSDLVAAEPPSVTSSTQIIEPPKDIKEETIVDTPYQASDQYHQLNGNEESSNTLSGWGNGLTNDHNELPVEQDSYGTGIKEDG